MEPRIQYAKTEDGVNIAYTVQGEGPPLVITPGLTLQSLQPFTEGISQYFGELAKRLRIVRYDCRGVGMSQRGAVDFSAEAAERDLDAVVNSLGLERFAIYGHTIAGEVPFAYAAHHPERVSCLVVWIGRRSQHRSPEIGRALEALDRIASDVSWDILADLKTAATFGLDSPFAAPYAKGLKSSHSRESRAAADLALRRAEEAAWYDQVAVPTLIAHLADSDQIRDLVRDIASRIATSYVIAIPGTPTMSQPFICDNEILTNAICDFVGSASAQESNVLAPRLDFNAMRAILWTDLEAHSAMMNSLGDAKGRDVLREHERITRDALAAYSGTEVKAMGDGFVAWFPSAQRALECAIALQRAISASRASEQLRIRVAVNAGEPIADEDPDGRTDLFGASVIAAARICSEAAGGEIVVSDVVRQLLAGKDFRFAERGAVVLKGFEDPVKLWELRWEGAS